ncbi:MAG: antibiotic biosynthesis monooxygenase [Bacteroidales bacterium]|nr:antibiotic biosynthesis monooxygenase [Bacteroidales bacterium]
MFVAINYITCKDFYREKFEKLFATRAKEVDTMPGFIRMQVLKPDDREGDYLIISHWKAEEDFRKWSHSPQFLEGHRRGFEDIAEAKRNGAEIPMKSVFKTYKVLTE